MRFHGLREINLWGEIGAVKAGLPAALIRGKQDTQWMGQNLEKLCPGMVCPGHDFCSVLL